MGLTIQRLGAAEGLSSTRWTPLVPPYDCNNLSISNREGADGLWICTDPTDAATQMFLPEGAEQGFAVPGRSVFEAAHFSRGTPAVYVKTVSGNGPVIVFWI